MKSRLTSLCLGALLALAAALPAAAENEAWYFPDGTLYVPYVNMQDDNGDTVARYAAFFQKRAGWNFKLYGLSEVSAAAGGVATNFVTSYVTNTVTISNFVAVTNYTSITNVYDGTNVFVTTNVNVTTNVFVTTNVNVTTNLIVMTNAPSATASVAGTWRFYFNEHYGRTFTGTEFGRTTNVSPVSFNVTLALTQTGTDVAGTGRVDSVQYALTGEVTNDFFVFTMLAGTTNKAVNLVAGQALVGDGALVGDYSWSTPDAAMVNVGDFYAEQE
ncbi:MAG: hypothetical protein AB7V22_01930 [Kiritimatiellia bacterium]